MSTTSDDENANESMGRELDSRTGSSLESDWSKVPNAITKADILQSSSVSKLWILTAVCGLISIGLFLWSFRSNGELIVLDFQDGHGLKLEDRLRYLGIDIGSVEKIELNSEHNGVQVFVRMLAESRDLAREGARFWIVRPVVSSDSVSGLETILGAKYIAFEPGTASGARQNRFRGLESAPVLAPRDGAMEILLDAKTRGGLENGAPLLYRGFRVGQVLSVGLATDARTVRARCAIDPEYRELIRQNTVFWNKSGWRIDVGLSGIRIDADTLPQILTGGIELATPGIPQPPVNTGQRFVLHDQPEPEWLQWQPSIAHGNAWSQLESQLPQPTRIALRWQERSFGFRTNKQLLGWCLPLSEGSFATLTSLVTPPAGTLQDSAVIEIAGQSFAPSQLQPKANSQALLTLFRFPDSTELDVERWPVNMLESRAPESLGNVVIAAPEFSQTLAIDATRLTAAEGVWIIDPAIHIGKDSLGQPVISVDNGKVVGFLAQESKLFKIVLLRDAPTMP